MSGTQPVAVYALRVPPGGALIPAVPDASTMFRVSMAAIDPDEAPEFEEEGQRPRATLKLIRPPPEMDLGESDEDDDEDDSEDDEDDEEVNGGPSDKEKARLLKEKALADAMDADDDEEDDDDDDDDEDGFDLQSAISKLIKGKAPATDDDDEDDDESDEGLDLDEMVVCTLDPERNYQQPLDLTVSEDERVFFKVTGTHTIYLTGNYVMPNDEGRQPMSDDEDEDEDDYDDYDLSPDEEDMGDLLDGYQDLGDDDLDPLENPRVTEVESEDEAPKLVETKGKGKRAAEQEEGKKSDAESKRQQKKAKKNNGEAAAAEEKKDAKDGKEKKVQFAKNLEQGPTPSGQDKKAEEKPAGTLGVKEVKGVKIDDKKLGKGPAAKSGNTVAMRYIGKLEDGKVFDANKKGKPFSFKLGKGEVIKGWDIGVAGMAVGGERRISIPPQLAYGKKALPGIPANSRLVFDVKLLEIK